jgi:NADH dehydrogenase
LQDQTPAGIPSSAEGHVAASVSTAIAATPANQRQIPSAGSRPKVLIIGAGFGGLEAARGLSRAAVDVVLLDKKNHHCFQPLLYQVATAALSPADVAWPIRSIVSNHDNVAVVMADVCAVDTTSKFVRTKEGDCLTYDYLVIATGAYSSYFNHPEWAQYAPGLKTIEDATRIRAKILVGLERAEKGGSEDEIKKFMTFVVVRGGPTGVELAGSIADRAKRAGSGFQEDQPAVGKGGASRGPALVFCQAFRPICLTTPKRPSWMWASK